MALLIYNKKNTALFQSAWMYLKYVEGIKENDIKKISIDHLYDLTNLPYPDLYPYKNENHYFLLEIEKLDSEEAALGTWDISYAWVAVLNNIIRNDYHKDHKDNMFFFGIKSPEKEENNPTNYYEAFQSRIEFYDEGGIFHKFSFKKLDDIMKIKDPNFVFAHGGSNG